MSLRIALLASASLVLAAPAFADEAQPSAKASQEGVAFTVGEVQITAAGAAGSAKSLLTSVDRLGGDVAQAANVDYAWELIGKMPGVLVTDFNQGTTSGKFSFRGFNGEGEINAVKLLIDGVPSNGNDGNMPYLDMVFPLDIAGVEVVRGTSDPRYGLHAIAGSANIMTRVGGTYLDAKALTGSYATYDAQVSTGYETGKFSQNYLVAYREADGYREHGALDRLSLAGKWFYTPTDSLRTGLIARYYKGSAQEPGYLTAAQAASAPRSTNAYNRTDGDTRKMGQYSLHLDWTPTSALSWSNSVYMNTLRDDRYVKFSATTSQQRRYADEDHWGAMTALRYEPQVAALSRLVFEIGGDVQRQDNISLRFNTVERVVSSQTRNQKFALTVGGVYVQSVIEPTAWLTLTPAWRIDWVDGQFLNRLTGVAAPINDYGAIQQPKFSVAVRPAQGVTVYGNWGKSFQVGVGSGAYLIAPRVTDLDPSINEGWEAGVRYAPTDRLTARLAIWGQTATGELKRKLNDPSGDFDNLGATKREGVDLQIDAKLTSRLSVWGAAAWQSAKIRTPDPATPALKGNKIDHVPARIFSGGVDYAATEKLTLSASASGQSAYELTTSNNRGRFGDYVSVDLDATYKVNPRLALSLQIKNLTDADREYVWWDGAQTLHSPADGRTAFISARVRY
ncbi:TonB-dependent receptor [Caulobacter vibrioides]|uniref:TonB-dependent receptor n=2 Tax=Caulobacter vibrioides TaxID=155892 RepID=Q9A7E2_CAUVC|nr:TonB-dependent receptor [Caulobacter vibrioides]YP_002517232.1 TonB-dependent receptor [Caulobacter vibrioides NA1000]AAK23757.1 TonB-dependent receptor [Caulobacter vibrioides CB15]ACL95324.1 TonB-dependent receptor [Caulobacter vibrioides NA1000]ATC28660.1 TonB-dependent receptor [Caulobacter vibrioides]AZH12916.1 TonB-dependent receptor [Caulobacter vibrioides]QXZ53842.1 TonB-dependent receptor [Caulobacter vibrioides]